VATTVDRLWPKEIGGHTSAFTVKNARLDSDTTSVKAEEG
jgi:hypothetical protein